MNNNINLEWDNRNDFTYSKLVTSQPEVTYLRLLEAANYIYDNRILLRSKKLNMVSRLKNVQKENKDSREIYLLMRDSYNSII